MRSGTRCVTVYDVSHVTRIRISGVRIAKVGKYAQTTRKSCILAGRGVFPAVATCQILGEYF